MLGHLGKDFRDFHAGRLGGNRLERPTNLGRRLGLGVPGIKLAGAANQDNHDAVDVLVLLLGGRLQAHPSRQSQTQPRQRPRMEKRPAIDLVAQVNGPIGIQSQHGNIPAATGRIVLINIITLIYAS